MATIVSVAAAKPARDSNSTVVTVLPPLMLCVLMMLAAALAAELARLDVRPLLSYFGSFMVTVVSLATYTVGVVVKSIVVREEKPLRYIGRRMLDRLPLLVLPAVIFPAFLMSYTTTKTAIPVLVGYTWDGFWANADRLIFGNDVWRICRAILGSAHTQFWEWWYSVVWGCVFVFGTNFVTLLGGRRLIGNYFTTMFATWLIGGCFMAYAFSAAGPVFAPIFDASLADRFLPLQEVLRQTLGHRSIATAQQYLLTAATKTHQIVKGGGISAFPSMHIATVSVYVLAARGTRWLLPAITFWILIFIGSGYFGFHYWIDGIVSAILAVLCWKAS